MTFPSKKVPNRAENILFTAATKDEISRNKFNKKYAKSI
jgi:hypothetical protein